MMPMDTNRHLDREEIENYSLQTTPESDVARVEEHLLVCTDCQKRVESSDVFVRAMHDAACDLRDKKAPAPRRFGVGMPLFALAFALGIVALVVLFPRSTGRENAPFAVTLSAIRGSVEATAPSGRPLVLGLDVNGIPEGVDQRIYVVDRNGKVVGMASLSHPRISPLQPGIYFVRLYSPGDELLREYALEVEAAK
jgi:hypothetical protein